MISPQPSRRMSNERPMNRSDDRTKTGYDAWPQSVITAFHIAFAVAAFVLSATALIGASATAGLVSIALADLFVVSLLRCCAIASTPNLERPPSGRAVKNSSSGRWEVLPYLPTRVVALILLPILMAALVAAFGGIYLSTGGGVVDSQTPAQPLVGRLDALYFSFVTITTLGYGDFHPVS